MVSTSSEQHRAYLVACMHYTRELAAEAHTMARAAHMHRGGLLRKKLDRDAGLAVVMARELTDICARLAEADIRVRQPSGRPASPPSCTRCTTRTTPSTTSRR